jgi:hypothetical protein
MMSLMITTALAAEPAGASTPDAAWNLYVVAASNALGDEAPSAVRRVESGLKACATAHARRTPPGFQATLRFAVGVEGLAKTIAVDASDQLDASLTGCLAAQLARAEFTARPDPGARQFVMLVFEVAGLPDLLQVEGPASGGVGAPLSSGLGGGGVASGLGGLGATSSTSWTTAAKLGVPQILGGLTQRDVDGATQRTIDGIRYCHERSLSGGAEITGRIDITLTVQPDGAVASAEVATSTLQHAAVEACVVERFRRTLFPRPTDGAGASITYPVFLELVAR